MLSTFFFSIAQNCCVGLSLESMSIGPDLWYMSAVQFPFALIAIVSYIYILNLSGGTDWMQHLMCSTLDWCTPLLDMWMHSAYVYPHCTDPESVIGHMCQLADQTHWTCHMCRLWVQPKEPCMHLASDSYCTSRQQPDEIICETTPVNCELKYPMT